MIRNLLLAATAFGFSVGASAEQQSFQGLQIEVRGSGKPVLMVPGLNSAASVWDDSCAALQKDGYACHLVQLPGFAGLPPLAQADDAEPAFLPVMRDRLLAYIDHAELKQPAVMGHSLGGVLGLMLALKAPDVIGKLVIVDSLPFFPAAMNAAATEETMRPMAEGMRTGMQASSDETYAEQTLAAAARGMSRDADRVKQIQSWGIASDRGTTTQAMYEMFSTDLRGQLDAVRSPTLVLGAWAAYEPMGSTLESTHGIFAAQYAKLPGVRIEMSQSAYHFIMYDDLDWMLEQVRKHLGE